MHLAIDALGAKHGGAGTIALRSVSASLQRPDVDRVTVFTAPRSALKFELPSSSRLEILEQPLAEQSLPGRLYWFQRGMALAVRRVGADRVVCLNGCGLGPEGRTTTLVQQSLPFSREAWLACERSLRLRMQVIRWLTGRASRRAAAVVVQTEVMRQTVIKAFHLDERRVCVATTNAPVESNGDALQTPQLAPMRLAPQEQRLLYVGNDCAYKNTDVLLNALDLVRARYPEARLFTTWPGDAPQINGRLGLIGLGYLPTPVLHQAYQLATVLVMPSLVETVGLPMLEAMSVGTAVVAADRPYAREVCSSAALLFDPHSPTDLAEKIVSVLESKSRRVSLAAQGRARAQEVEETRPYDRLIAIALNGTGR